MRQQRAALNNAVQYAIAHPGPMRGGGTTTTPQIFSAFYNIVKSNGPIDFKNNFPGANFATMGLAGNFAYYAIESGYFSNTVLDAGAGTYGLYAAIRPNTTVHFSDLTGPLFSDAAAASQRAAGLSANGCPI